MLSFLTVIGARPQFIKAAALSKQVASDKKISETLVHTGQHFDDNMSEVFFREMGIPRPKYNLGISGLGHGAMTGRMLEKIELIIQNEQPSCVLVYGDTNSTLAGALAASKVNVPVVHVEAGLRSHNMLMPEETNRIITDRLSSVLLCPSNISADNLRAEGFPFQLFDKRNQHISIVGDIMYDSVLNFRAAAKKYNTDYIDVKSPYALCTVHRQENSDSPRRMKSIFSALSKLSKEFRIILPVHPRLRGEMDGLDGLSNIKLINPVSYFEMQTLLMNASLVLTDSGGLQKEAFFHGAPCVTLRDETEWTETVEAGWNVIAGADCASILLAVDNVMSQRKYANDAYGEGNAAQKIIDEVKGFL